jgi:catecholate siderophore receptor
MAPIKNRKRDSEDFRRLTNTAAATLLAFALPTGAAMAQEAAQTLPTVDVTAPAPINDYKLPEKASSPKYTAPLLDTPQSITVVPKKVIEDQKLLSLRDILSTVPGITFGAGEGGGGFGDSINLRGFSGSNDITIDGVRDSAQYTRSDPFNLEQIEVINGANSAYAGAGSVGGSINLVSKTPKRDDFGVVSGALGSDSYGRATADINRVLRDGVAARLNLMMHKNDAPGRDYEYFERWGVAPSITFGLSSPTQLTLSYLHQHDKSLPQYGVPYINNLHNNGPLPGVDSENYYGYRNVDTQESDTDMLTATLDHAFNDNFSVRNLTRWQRTTQLLVVDPPQGNWCLASGVNPYTGAACTSPGVYQPSGPRGNTRDTENTLLYNQTDLTSKFNTGFIEHTLVTGLAFSHEEYRLNSGNSLRNADGTAAVLPPMDIYNPDSYWTGPQNFFTSSKQDGEVNNASIYAFDTLKLNRQWELNGGVRLERNKAEHRTDVLPARGDTLHNDDTLFSYRAGVVYKPVQNGSIYIAYGNSETPSKASVNGSCASISNSTGVISANNCNADPEEAVNYEIGTKWDLLNGQLSLTAAVFRNDQKNYQVPSGDPAILEDTLDGHARVDGLLLGIGGLITRHWSVFANYSYLDSEVLQGASNRDSAAGKDYTKGDPLRFIPKHAFSLWTTYDLPRGWQVGYGATYQGTTYAMQHDAKYPSGPLAKTGAYWVHRMMVAYKVTRQLSLQLNVNNLFDEEYYTRIRNNPFSTNPSGWSTPGEGRSATLTASYKF